MTHGKPTAFAPEGAARPESFVREAGAPAPVVVDGETFLDRWLARHFAASVRLFDLQRATLAEGEEPLSPETERVLADLELVQDVLFELRELATGAPSMSVPAVEGAVLAVYAWLEETLDAVARAGAAFRKSPSFVDAAEGGAPLAMLRAFERMHPSLEVLVVGGAPVADAALAQKLALCFRQIGAAIVRVSGRGATTVPPPDGAPTFPPRKA